MLKYGAFESLHAIQPSKVAKGFVPVHLTTVNPGFAARSVSIFRASPTLKLSVSLMLVFVKSVM